MSSAVATYTLRSPRSRASSSANALLPDRAPPSTRVTPGHDSTALTARGPRPAGGLAAGEDRRQGSSTPRTPACRTVRRRRPRARPRTDAPCARPAARRRRGRRPHRPPSIRRRRSEARDSARHDPARRPPGREQGNAPRRLDAGGDTGADHRPAQRSERQRFDRAVPDHPNDKKLTDAGHGTRSPGGISPHFSPAHGCGRGSDQPNACCASVLCIRCVERGPGARVPLASQARPGTAACFASSPCAPGLAFALRIHTSLRSKRCLTISAPSPRLRGG